MENEDKCLAWFPAPFLELWDGEEDDDAAYQLGGVILLVSDSFLACTNRTHINRKKFDYTILSPGIGVRVDITLHQLF